MNLIVGSIIIIIILGTTLLALADRERERQGMPLDIDLSDSDLLRAMQASSNEVFWVQVFHQTFQSKWGKDTHQVLRYLQAPSMDYDPWHE